MNWNEDKCSDKAKILKDTVIEGPVNVYTSLTLTANKSVEFGLKVQKVFKQDPSLVGMEIPYSNTDQVIIGLLDVNKSKEFFETKTEDINPYEQKVFSLGYMLYGKDMMILNCKEEENVEASRKAMDTLDESGIPGVSNDGDFAKFKIISQKDKTEFWISHNDSEFVKLDIPLKLNSEKEYVVVVLLSHGDKVELIDGDLKIIGKKRKLEDGESDQDTKIAKKE